MITAIRVSDLAILKSTTPPTVNYSQYYDSVNEQIIWVDDEANFPEGTAMTKHELITEGGDPIFPTMEL